MTKYLEYDTINWQHCSIHSTEGFRLKSNQNGTVDHVLCTVQVTTMKKERKMHFFCLFLCRKSLLSNATTTNKAGVSILVGKICHVYCFNLVFCSAGCSLWSITVPSWLSQKHPKKILLQSRTWYHYVNARENDS